MRKILLPAVLAALVLAGQPVFMAGAKTQLFVTDENVETTKDSQGRTNVYNGVPVEGEGYTVPYLSDKGSKSKVSSGIRYQKAQMPKAWKVLDSKIISNRVSDTKNALAFSSKQRKHMNAATIGINRFDEDDAAEEANKKARKAKKKAEKEAEKAAEQMNSVGQPKEQAAGGDVEDDSKSKKGVKFRKKTLDSGSKRVFNPPD
ncbi:MAG: hypothetical protein IPH06_03815 [Alphaproteobacteria bacterium]|nr:hypothetical protein [Alphaproteobacteria bacterium]QQS57163.1 MAG: hypothetical protein IPN28_13130 [Alphaproteobacteria bacterium]